MPKSRPFLFIAISILLSACSDPQPKEPAPKLGSWFEQPMQEWPQSISVFGLYPNVKNLDQVPPGALPYAPTYPLWSNGSLKFRHIILPKGGQIDATNDRDAWVYPTGTIVFKTFSFETETGLKPIETRVMRKEEEDGAWSYAHYQWREDGSEADRLEMRLTVPVEVKLTSGETVTHVIPNKLQCRQCHEASPRWILGLSGRQLEGDEQIEALNQQNAFKVPLTAPTESLGQGADGWVKGYFLGNCVHCHNGWGESPNSTYSLYPEDVLKNTINQPTEGNASAVGTRIIPGDAAQSILFQAVKGYDDDPELKAMPPLGVQKRDTKAIEQLKDWINQLPTE